MRSRKGPAQPAVHRSARVALRLTPGQARRCYQMLRAGADVWAALIELNAVRFHRLGKPLLGYAELCREVAGTPVGELSVTAIRSVVKRYSDACMETARRKRRGERARLYLDVTAEVPVEQHDLDVNRVAGVDPGIIHPYAVVGPGEALVVSGRALRAEERLHLADTKARAARMGSKAPGRGQRGSRRWRKLLDSQRKAEARHRRRVHQAHHEAAKAVVGWAVEKRLGTLVIGDPKGITLRDAGRRQNRRLRQWRRGHLTRALADKARLAGIAVMLIDERGTSSTCPVCRVRVPKPKGRVFTCGRCGLVAHRDVVGATNIAARGGGTTSVPALVTHRRAGVVPARRDRRRHLMDGRRRSCPAPGRPGRSPGSRSSGSSPVAEPSARRTPRAA